MTKKIFITLILLMLGGALHAYSENTYNVKDFGAKGDGVTDDTRAVQSAVTAAAAKGGIVFFPNGIYHIGGPVVDSVDGRSCFSQLYIPHSPIEDSKNIVFQGETAPEFEMQGIIEAPPSGHGAIIYSSVVTDNPAHAVISMQKGPDDPWAQWNYTTPGFKDIGVRTRTITASGLVVNSMNGINLRFASKCYLDNVLIDTDSPMSLSLDPTGSGSTGLTTPGVNNHAMISVGLVRIAGYDFGLKCSEHFVGRDIQLVCCNTGLFVEVSHHSSSIQTLEIECCKYSIVFAPGHNLFVANYNTEHFTDEKWWFHFVRDVTFEGDHYYKPKIVIGLCHPEVSFVGYDPGAFSTNDQGRVVLLEKR